MRGYPFRAANEWTTRRGHELLWSQAAEKLGSNIDGSPWMKGLAAYNHCRFRQGRDVHKWMSDRYSLAKALESAGFAEIERVGPSKNRVSNWTDFNLDTEPDRSTYKPDSLFMETILP